MGAFKQHCSDSATNILSQLLYHLPNFDFLIAVFKIIIEFVYIILYLFLNFFNFYFSILNNL